jgi:ribosomal-protein-alanine N-acetyltransferase
VSQANSLRRGRSGRVPGASSARVGSEVGRQPDHPRFASKLRQEKESGFTRQDALHTRWMIRRDLERVVSIEQQAFENPWDRTILERHLRPRDNMGIVVTVEGEIAGFCIYQNVRGEGTKVLKIAVAPEYRRQGIGFFMLDSLFQKEWLKQLEVRVAEDNLVSQQFLRACGFRAVPHRDAHEGDDDYRSILFRADLAEIRAITGR